MTITNDKDYAKFEAEQQSQRDGTAPLYPPGDTSGSILDDTRKGLDDLHALDALEEITTRLHLVRGQATLDGASQAALDQAQELIENVAYDFASLEQEIMDRSGGALAGMAICSIAAFVFGGLISWFLF